MGVWESAEQQRRRETWLSDLLVTSSSNWFFPRCAVRLSLPTRAHISLSWGIVRVSVHMRVRATSWDWDRWADSDWLHVFALCQNALPGGPDLHATEGNTLPAAAGLLVQNPSVLFHWNWHTEVTAVFTSPSWWKGTQAHTPKGWHSFFSLSLSL